MSNQQYLTSQMQPKYYSLKSTDKQTFSIKNYVALSFLSHLGIRRSELQHLVKHHNKKLFFPFYLFL